jgi:hypothetical protein
VDFEFRVREAAVDLRFEEQMVRSRNDAADGSVPTNLRRNPDLHLEIVVSTRRH